MNWKRWLLVTGALAAVLVLSMVVGVGWVVVRRREADTRHAAEARAEAERRAAAQHVVEWRSAQEAQRDEEDAARFATQTVHDPDAPFTITATVTRVSGSSGIGVGDPCRVHVRRPFDAPPMTCRAIVSCSGVSFRDMTSGVLPCTSFSRAPLAVVAADSETTRGDGDGTLAVDTAAGTVTIGDDASGAHGELRIVAHIDGLY